MNEADTDQSQDHTPQDVPNLETPNHNILAACQEHINNRDHTGGKPEQDIRIETRGKIVGRNKRPITTADVFKLAAIGCKDIEIAEWFGIDSNTLRYNFSVELLKGRETLKQSLRRKQIEVAMSGNPTMLIFLGKNLLGQSDSPVSSQEAQVLPWEDD